MNFDSFQYRNLDPSSDLKIFANRCIERLREAAPYLSTFIPTLEFKEGKYTCTIEVYSHWGNYKSTSTAYFPEAAIIWSEHKINSQLWRWKEKRFSNLDDHKAFDFTKTNHGPGDSGYGNESRH